MIPGPEIRIDEELAKKVKLAPVWADGLVIDDAENLWAVFEPFCREMAQRYEETTISQVPGIEPARELYKAIGVDPTRHRPSSEALLRRLIKNRDLYRINSLVDTINYCSLSFLLPIGLYDLDHVRGELITLRRGDAGDHYSGIGKDQVNLEGRYALFDSEGPFGSPTSDSERTMIRDSTTRALALIFAPFQFSSEVLESHADFTADQISRFGGGHPESEVTELVA